MWNLNRIHKNLLSWASSIQPTPSYPFNVIHFNVIFPSLPTSLTLIFPSGSSYYNSVCIFHLFHEYYIFFSHCLWFDHPNNIWWRAHIVSPSLCSFFPTSYCFLSLRSKYILHTTLFLNSLNACSSLRMRQKASHSYKVSGIIIVLHTLISRLLTGNGNQAFCLFYLLLTSP
jgi:hypothetical protein